MAPSVRMDSYDWTNDTSEMTSRGASYPGEPGTIYLSNQSYGYISGWNYTGSASPQWELVRHRHDEHGRRGGVRQIR